MEIMHRTTKKSGCRPYTGIRFLAIAIVAVLTLPLFLISLPTAHGAGEVMKLPEPIHDGKMSLEKTMLQRRSIRAFRDDPLTLSEIAQLLWAAQGVTSPNGYRTAPSAGALYPLEVFVVAGKVDGLSAGIYRYRAQAHDLIRVAEGDRRSELSQAALGQSAIRRAPAVLVIAGVFQRTTRKYGGRGNHYVYMESGNASQNIALQAVSLGLGSVVIGAFSDNAVKGVLGVDSEEPLIIMPVGRP